MAQFYRVCHLDDCSSSVQRHYSLIACPTLKALIKTGLMWYESGHTKTLYILNKQINKQIWETQLLKVPEFLLLLLLHLTNTVMSLHISYLNMNSVPRQANTLVFQHSFFNRGKSPKGMEYCREQLSSSGCEKERKFWTWQGMWALKSQTKRQMVKELKKMPKEKTSKGPNSTDLSLYPKWLICPCVPNDHGATWLQLLMKTWGGKTSFSLISVSSSVKWKPKENMIIVGDSSCINRKGDKEKD